MRLGRQEISIVVLLLLVVGLFLFWRTKEGFDAEANAAHAEFTRTQQGTRNPIGTALTAAGAAGNLGTDTQGLFGSTGLTGSGEAVAKTESSDPYPLNDGKQGLFGAIQKCEAVANTDPTNFDNPDFIKDCGICFDVGKDASNKPKTGGMFMLASEKEYARKYQKRGNRIPEYKPTFGSCPAGRFATTKEEAQRIQNDLACQKSKDFNLPGCSQCYSDGNFYIVDQAVITETRIVFDGAGKYTITTPREQMKGTMGFSQKPMAQFGHFSEALKEGETINLRVEQLDDTSVPIRCMLYGVLSGFTSKGRFDIDLRRLVQADNVTKSKVRTRGINSMTSPPSTIMIPGAGQKSMDLQIVIPFSFTEDDTLESDQCPDAPFITKKASAEFLGSDPCYKSGTGPGSFTQECLQGLFTQNGCMESGRGYPRDQRAVTALLYTPNNQPRQLAEIANFIYDQAVRAAMGMSQSGQKLSITEWSESSEFCTGKRISSVCDSPGNDVGPVSYECLKVLWNNEGAGKPLGPTYTITSSAQSLRPASNVALFCTLEGTASPMTPQGTPNAAAIEMYQKLGGIDAVKAKMNEIHRLANDNMITEVNKAAAILQCYGKTPAAAPPPVGAAPSSKCKPGCGPKVRKVKIQMNGDWLNFSEVVIRDTDGRNVGIGKSARASSVYPWDNGITKVSNPLSGVEGARSYYSPPYNFHGNDWQTYRDFWEVDLGSDHEISSVTIYNRADCCWDRLAKADLILINSTGQEIEKRRLSDAMAQTIYFGTQSQDCLNCTTINEHEAYLVKKDNGTFVREDGPSVCSALGASPATFQQVQSAQQMGADTCEKGFVSDSAALINPISNSTRCGPVGVNSTIPPGSGEEWVTAGYENQNVNIPFATQVRYGKYDRWAYRNVNAGMLAANNSTFGDPIFGTYKELQYKKPPAKPTGSLWCYGPRPTGNSVVAGGRRVATGGQTYTISNFSQSSYSRPPSMPGSSV